MEFKRGGFVINGKESKEFNVVMRERPAREAAERVIELRERPGNDSIVVDFNYHKNTTQRISCYAKAKTLQAIPFLEKEITYWLDMGNYSDYLVYYDPHYIYQAVVTSAPKFTGQRRNGLIIPFEFTISIRPFKMARTGMSWRENEKILINSENYLSKPKIHLLGNGDGSFFINDREYKVKGMNSELYIDSRTEESYVIQNKSIQFQDKKTLFKDYPYLDKGENRISWTSTINKLLIMPRWWTKI